MVDEPIYEGEWVTPEEQLMKGSFFLWKQRIKDTGGRDYDADEETVALGDLFEQNAQAVIAAGYNIVVTIDQTAAEKQILPVNLQRFGNKVEQGTRLQQKRLVWCLQHSRKMMWVFLYYPDEEQ